MDAANAICIRDVAIPVNVAVLFTFLCKSRRIDDDIFKTGYLAKEVCCGADSNDVGHAPWTTTDGRGQKGPSPSCPPELANLSIFIIACAMAVDFGGKHAVVASSIHDAQVIRETANRKVILASDTSAPPQNLMLPGISDASERAENGNEMGSCPPGGGIWSSAEKLILLKWQ